ncbi:MAG: hypothetical protein RSE41_07825, partial [Clostridia bacterium]
FTNNGTLKAENVIFKDILSACTKLVEHSFTVNGVSINYVDLEKGVDIGTIDVNSIIIVEYQVVVVSTNCSIKLVNSAYVKFNYILPDGSTGVTKSKVVESSVYFISNCKKICIERSLPITTNKYYIECINNVAGYVDITKYNTVKIASSECQYSSRYKLIIQGELNLIVKYTTCSGNTHSAYYLLPFNTSIVLLDDYSVRDKLIIDALIEDIYFNEIDCVSLFTSSKVLINVSILNR